MQAELKLSGIKNVCVHNLSPGMVTTELLMSGEAIFELPLLTGQRLALTEEETGPCRWGHTYCKILYQLSGRATRSGCKLPGPTDAKSDRRYEDPWEWEDLIH